MNMLTKSCALVLAGSLFAASAAAGQISIEANRTVPVRIPGSAASIVLGNKNVADVAVHDEHLIFITGKTFGTTNLMIFNKAGDQIYTADITVTVSAANQVTVNRSGQNYTYECSPDCHPVMVPGDQSAYFDSIVRQQQATQALNGGQ